MGESFSASGLSSRAATTRSADANKVNIRAKPTESSPLGRARFAVRGLLASYFRSAMRFMVMAAERRATGPGGEQGSHQRERQGEDGVLELDHLKHDAYTAFRHGSTCRAAKRNCAVLVPGRNVSVVCFERVTAVSTYRAVPDRNDAVDLEFGAEMGPWRAITALRRKVPGSNVDKQPAELFRSACPPPNLPKIITIYASTSVGEFQGLAGCGRIVAAWDLRDRSRLPPSLANKAKCAELGFSKCLP